MSEKRKTIYIREGDREKEGEQDGEKDEIRERERESVRRVLLVRVIKRYYYRREGVKERKND